MSNSLDPDQARHFVGPDLGPNCLQRLSADDISKQRANTMSPRQSQLVMSSRYYHPYFALINILTQS